jgi:CBS domain-containing protein
MSLERFCRKRVVTARPFETVADVARRMRDEHVGAVVIVTDRGVASGIVTDRDLVVRVLAEGADSAGPIEDAVTGDPVTLGRDAKLDDVVRAMAEAGVRRIPIVDGDGVPVGLVSMDDVSVLLAGELSASAEAVQDNRGP